MKAARLYGPRDLRVEEVPVPRLRPEEVLVRVRATAICASDWRLYTEGHAGGVPLPHPIIQGHEFAGEIAALGEGTAGPPIGTRVAVEPSWHCGTCDLCQAGHTTSAETSSSPAHPRRRFSRVSRVPFSLPLPENVSDIAGA